MSGYGGYNGNMAGPMPAGQGGFSAGSSGPNSGQGFVNPMIMNYLASMRGAPLGPSRSAGGFSTMDMGYGPALGSGQEWMSQIQNGVNQFGSSMMDRMQQYAPQMYGKIMQRGQTGMTNNADAYAQLQALVAKNHPDWNQGQVDSRAQFRLGLRPNARKQAPPM